MPSANDPANEQFNPEIADALLHRLDTTFRTTPDSSDSSQRQSDEGAERPTSDKIASKIEEAVADASRRSATSLMASGRRLAK
jgi:hypothetical protein